jgi:DNA modification methylase
LCESELMQSLPIDITPKKPPAISNNLRPIKIQVCNRRVEELVLDPSNPRRHPQKKIKQLAAGIQEFGFLVPVLIDGSGRVVAGHARVIAAKRLGLVEVPVVEVHHLSASRLRAFRLADNKLALNASWDQRLLAKELKELTEIELDFSVSLTGFSTPEIDLIISKQHNTPIMEDLGAGASDALVCRRGDVWQLGKHRIICADATMPSTFDILMDGNRAEMIFCDPIDNALIECNVSGQRRVKHSNFRQDSGEMSRDEFSRFLTEVCRNLGTSSKDGALHFVCMDWRHIDEMMAVGREIYSELKNLVVWVKDNAGLGSLYRSAHELIFIFKCGSAPHIKNIELGRHGPKRSNVWHYESVATSERRGNKSLEIHPTVKPVNMIMDAILDCSERGGIVLDAFLGSGTTLLAAERTSRICYGVELEPRYIDVAIRRWQNLTGEDALLLGCGTSFNQMERNNER